MKYKELNKTLVEVEEEKYRRKRPIRISRAVAFLMLVGVVSFALFSVLEGSFSHSKLSAEDGAGTYWTCSNCGSSNKCYEMSCSNCDNWR